MKVRLSRNTLPKMSYIVNDVIGFLQSLPFPDYHGDKVKAKNAYVGTCEWIFDHPQYLAWCKDVGSSVLHAMGKPGSGKTVLSRHVLEALQGINSTQLLYCFCNNRDNPNQTAPDILGAMIHQFISDRKYLFPLVFEQFCRSIPSPWPLESLWDIFLVLVDLAQLDVVYCIIDALDECETESVSDLLSLISDMARGVKKVKFFLTSRPFERLEVELDHKIVRVIRLTPEVVNQDIKKIVDDGMDKLQKKLHLKKEIRDRLWEILVDRSEGMFLWVVLAMKQLDRARFVTAKKLEKLIQALPNGLNGIYDGMLESLETNISDLEDLSLIRRMITWVVLAQRPLTISEFKVAIAIELDSDSMDSIEMMLHISREIRNLCGSFLEIVSERGPKSIRYHDHPEDDDYEDPAATVRLIHQSAKDYFFDREKQLSSPLSEFRIYEKYGHDEIALMCLTYLLFKDFGTGALELNSSISGTSPPIDEDDEGTTLRKLLEQRVLDYPFLRYAVLAWGYHVRNGIEGVGRENIINPTVMKVACQFLEKPRYLEYWFQLYEFLEYSEVHGSQKVNALYVTCLMNLPTIAAHILNNWSIGIDEYSGEGKTALLFAVDATLDSTDSEILRVILGCNPDVNARDKNGESALVIAAGRGNQLSTIKLLLDGGANIEIRKGDFTALHLASTYGHRETAELLLNRGADIESKTNDSLTPLVVASNSEQREMVEFLLGRGANIESKQAQGQTALHQACSHGYKETAELLLGRGADIESRDYYSSTPLLRASSNRRKETIEMLLEKGADIESKDCCSSTALHMASGLGYIEIVGLLLEKGADIESKDDRSWTPLLTASYSGHKETVELLLDKGADIESKDDRSWTPLHTATSSGHKQVVELILGRGADIESKQADSWTALHIAVWNGQKEIIELLLDRGADIERTDFVGQTALHLAVSLGDEEITRSLLSRGAAVRSECDDNWTSCHTAVLSNYTGVLQLFADRRGGILADVGEECGELLQSAVLSGNIETVELLLNSGASAGATSSRACTALHTAAYEGAIDIFNTLLEHKADPHLADSNGWSPIICAWRSRRQAVIERLLELESVLPDPNHISTRAPTCWSDVDKSALLSLSKDKLCVRVPGGKRLTPKNLELSL